MIISDEASIKLLKWGICNYQKLISRFQDKFLLLAFHNKTNPIAT